MRSKLESLRQSYLTHTRAVKNKQSLSNFRKSLIDKISQMNSHYQNQQYINDLPLKQLNFNEFNMLLTNKDPFQQLRMQPFFQERFVDALNNLDNVDALKMLINLIKHPLFSKKLITKQFVTLILQRIIRDSLQSPQKLIFYLWVLIQSFAKAQGQSIVFSPLQNGDKHIIQSAYSLLPHQLVYLHTFKNLPSIHPNYQFISYKLKNTYQNSKNSNQQQMILQIISGYLLFSYNPEKVKWIYFTLNLVFQTLKDNRYTNDVKSYAISLFGCCLTLDPVFSNHTVLLNPELVERIVYLSKFSVPTLMIPSIQVLCLLVIYFQPSDKIITKNTPDIVDVLCASLCYHDSFLLCLVLKAIAKIMCTNKELFENKGVQKEFQKLQRHQNGEVYELSSLIIDTFMPTEFQIS